MLPAIHTPELITKQLKFNTVGGKRKVRVSSNFLNIMGFMPGQGLSIQPHEHMSGFSVKVAGDSEATHKVYHRKYRSGRSNNPLETVMEFASQNLLDAAFPAYTENFSVEMRTGIVRFTPLRNKVFSIIQKFKKSNPWTAFVGLTGGVDVHVMEALGWKTEIVLEYRPKEARDVSSGRDLSEVHALSALFNGSPRILINEDIHHLEIDRLAHILSECPPIGLAHYSLGCDDHSTAKSNNAKAKSIADMSTMIDMVYPALRQIETMEPAVVVVENVRAFATSAAGVMMTTSLRRMGYHVTEGILNGLNFDGYQGRKRYYLVASVFPGFKHPTPMEPRQASLWPLIESYLGECRDITETKMVADRVRSPQRTTPYLTADSISCPTILKSQDRGIKDGVYIEHNGRVYQPSVNLLKALMSIPDEFNVDWMAKEQATETLGQSVDYKLHYAVLAAVKEHIAANCGVRTLLKHTLK